MSIFLMVEPLNKMEEKNRVCGWRHVPWTRKGKAELSGMAQNLKQKGVTCIYGSDLDEDAGRLVAHELGVEWRGDFRLRRFNVGRHHGAKVDYFTGIVDHILAKWESNRDIPVRGGDSFTSVERRLIRTGKELAEKQTNVAILTDARSAALIVYGEPKAFAMNGTSGLKPGKVYTIGLP